MALTGTHRASGLSLLLGSQSIILFQGSSKDTRNRVGIFPYLSIDPIGVDVVDKGRGGGY